MGIFDFFKKGKQGHPDSASQQQPIPPADTDLKAEVMEVIMQEVNFGFGFEDEILETIWAMGFDNEDQLNEDWLKHMIATHYRPYQEESRKWSRPTDFDRLATVFDELNSEKIIALHKAGYTQQDGYSDVAEAAALLQESNIVPDGYCFYHTQDLERAIDPGNRTLFLTFDGMEEDTAKAIAIAQRIVAKLHQYGFATEWNGTEKQRIKIKDLVWQKIPDNEDWGIGRAVAYMQRAAR